jgi:cell division protein FtsI (penicillin-binding protein 3)
MALLFGAFCIIQIFNLVFVQRDMFSGEAKYCLDKTQDGWKNSPLVNDPNCRCVVNKSNITPMRGDILDDKGGILASNITVFDVTIDGRKLMPEKIQTRKEVKVNDTLYVSKEKKISRTDKQAVNKLIADLSEQFYHQFKNKFPKQNKEYYRVKLAEAILEYKNVIVLKSLLKTQNTIVTSKDTAFILKLPLFQNKSKHNCLNFTSYTKRIYPYGELGRQAIGAILPERECGVEMRFDKYLSGAHGSQKLLHIDGIRVPSEKFADPKDGINVHTTLNLRMQNIVYEALADKLHQLNAVWGTVVLMEVKTGEIKAMANLTKYFDQKGEFKGYFELYNHAFRSESEPGSTFKLASLLAYLDKTSKDNEKTYLLCGCEIEHILKKGKKVPTCKNNKALHRLVTPSEIFQRSSNEGIGTLICGDVYKNNQQGFLAALDSMGITMKMITQLDTVIPLIERKIDLYEFYATTWGKLKMAPIQTLTYFNGIANNGKMICPKVVHHITDRERVIEYYPTVVLKERMTRKDVIERAKKYLEEVVTGPYGTARAYKDTTLKFAGKTGTRDIWNEEKGAYDKGRNSISFCGYFPADKPQYSMIVYLYNVEPKSGLAVQLFYTIAKRVMSEETMNEVDKSGGVKTAKYAEMVR